MQLPWVLSLTEGEWRIGWVLSAGGKDLGLMSRSFQDHFSTAPDEYERYRPTYPLELYEWLAHKAPARECAWDCGTGNGQAAVGLAAWFQQVVATDASVEQLAHARPAANVHYRALLAESAGLRNGSIDLVTVAQALHWFDRPRFFAEVERVLRPAGVLACWMYNLMRISPEVDRVVGKLYRDIVGPFWPGDRALIDENYVSIKLPFSEIEVPPFVMQAHWTLEQLRGYLQTWSAVARYRRQLGRNPLVMVEEELEAAWGGIEGQRLVTWPLVVRVAVRTPST